MSTQIRRARPGDEAAIVAMIHELADFERASEQCTVTESHITTALFGDSGDADEPPVASCFLVDVDGDTAAMALWFRNFSTWDGVPGIHLEDLYVRDRFRRRGLARSLLATLAAECVENGYSRLSWAVLDWNTDAITLYDSVGGRPLTEWITYRVSGDELSALAGRADDVSH
jgi:GNAT superfamily N-acetyltransferase